MTTHKLVLTDAWQQVAAAEDEFFLENPTEYKAIVAFSDTAPVTDIGHTLMNGFGLTRMGLVGNVYAKISPDNVEGAFPYLIVS